MFTVEGVRKFHQWTHASLSLLLGHLASLPPDACQKELDGFGFRTVHHQVMHVFNCEGFWIGILQGQSYIDRDPADFPGISGAVRLQREIGQGTLQFLSSLTDERLNADTELNFPDGDRAHRTPSLVLHHVFTHAFHHKGQVVAMCRALGYPAPDTDLNQFE